MTSVPSKISLAALMAIPVAVPLAMWPWAYGTCEPVKLFIFRSLLLILAGALVVDIVARGRFRLKKTPFDLPVGLLVALYSVAAAGALHPHTAVYGQLYRYDGMLSVATYAALFFAVPLVVRKSSQLLSLVKIVAVASAVVSLYAIAQRFGFDPISWNFQRMDLSRSFSTFGNPVFLGAYLALAVPVVLSLVIVARRSEERLGWAVCLGLDIAALAFSSSRMALLVALVAAAVVVVFHWKDLSRVLIPLGVAVVVAAGVYVPSAAAPALARRLGATVAAPSAQLTPRVALWGAASRAVSARPLTGFGADSFRLVFPKYKGRDWYTRVEETAPPDKAHNELLDTAVGIGVLGVLTKLWLWTLLLLALIRLWREETGWRRTLAGGVVAGLLAYAAQSLTSFEISSVAPIFWLGLGAFAVIPGLFGGTRLDLRGGHAPNQAGGLTTDRTALLGVVAVVIVGLLLWTGFRVFVADTKLQSAWMLRQSAQYNPGQADWAAVRGFMDEAVALNPGESRYFLRAGEASLAEFRVSPDQEVYERATQSLRTSAELNPFDKDIYFLLGDLERERARAGLTDSYGPAAKEYKRVFNLDPFDADAHFELGLTSWMGRDGNRAVAHLRRALELNPSLYEAYYAMAEVYQKTGRKGEAEKTLGRLKGLRNASSSSIPQTRTPF